MNTGRLGLVVDSGVTFRALRGATLVYIPLQHKGQRNCPSPTGNTAISLKLPYEPYVSRGLWVVIKTAKGIGHTAALNTRKTLRFVTKNNLKKGE